MIAQKRNGNCGLIWMKQPSVLFILIVFPVLLRAQIGFNKTSHHFGALNRGSVYYTDFIISNLGAKTAYFLRVDKDEELSFRLSGKTIAPDSSILLRVQYNPKSKGDFNKQVKVYLSSSPDPIVLNISGSSDYADSNSLQDCPDFSGTKKVLLNSFYVSVRDAKNGDPIESAVVEVIQRGEKIHSLVTRPDGIAVKPLQPGMYYLVAQARNYADGEQDVYVNRTHDSATIYLNRIEKSLPVAVAEEKEKPVEATKVQEHKKEPEPKPVAVEEKRKEMPAETSKTPEHTALLNESFAPNNLVFLVDLSSSMNEKGKLDLLKASMLAMLDALRPQDRVAIVSFASGTQLLLPSTPAADKKKIASIIRNLEASGFTAGAKGIKEAYETANNNYIERGNNQVIIATDGAFNVSKDERDLPATIQSNSGRNIRLSVLGIKNKPETEPAMKRIAEQGQGHYLHIEKYRNAKTELINEIKSMSARN